MPAIQRTLRRVFQMPLPELVSRGRQETFKLVDRLRPTWSAVNRDEIDLAAFLRNSKECFFAGPFEELPLRNREEILSSADQILRGRFDLLGYRELELGDHPDWHFDAISGCRIPLVHWSRLDPTNFASVGDCKVVWELNRHQWLVRLGQAYRLTNDERYAHVAMRHIHEWIAANPPGMGINWASSLEVSFRLISWCWTLALIGRLDSKIVASVDEHARHIERYLSYYFSPNTHLTGEALGLFYASIVFPRLKRADRWRSIATQILVEQIDRQILDDGIYFERTTCYQRYTADFYLHFLILAARGGIVLPSSVKQRVRSMIDALIALRNPEGTMPQIGDADGGRLLPLGKANADDFSATFSTAAVLFEDPSYAWAAREVSDETLWLLGSTAAERFAAIEQTPPASGPSRLFAAGGFAVMRSGWDSDAHSLIFDAGPLGCPNSSGHGHADLLSIQCSAFGKPYLVDAGTCCYTVDRELRDFFRSTAAHSTVMIDEQNQAEPAGPFSWQQRPEATLREWVSKPDLTFAEAEHDAYPGIVHRRRVDFMNNSYWIITDDLEGAGDHKVEVRFQFAPMKLEEEEGGWIRASNDEKNALLIRAFSSLKLDVEIRESWISPDYGQLKKAPLLIYSTTTQLPVRIVTLLSPNRCPSPHLWGEGAEGG